MSHLPATPAGMDPVLLAVAAHGLPTMRSFSAGPLAPASWAQLLAAVADQRLSGMLVRTISDGGLSVTHEQLAQAQALHEEAIVQCLLLERVLLDTTRRFVGAAIDYRVMKGPALAHSVYPEPDMRCFGDIDVLVGSDDLDRAVAVLVAAGHERTMPELRPGYDRRFGKGATFTTPGGLEIDLHRTLVDGRFGLLARVEDLFASSWSVTIGGQTVVTLAPEERFVQVCFNAAIGSRDVRLAPLRDVVQLALTTELDVDRVRALCRRWQAEAVLALAVSRAWHLLEVDASHPLAAWAAGYAPSRTDAVALRRQTASDATWGSIALLGASAVPGVRGKLAYLHAIVLPGRGIVGGGRFGPASRWVRGLVMLLRATRARVHEMLT